VRRRLDDGRAVLEVLGPLHRSDNQRDSAVGFLTAVQQPQRLGDPPRILVVLNGDRLLVEVRLRVVGGMLAVGHRNRAEVLARRPGQVHVPLGDHRHLRGRRGRAVRIRERIVDTRRIGVLHQPRLHLPEPHPERSLKAIYVRDANAPESAEPELIRARRGVILGSGGFEHNEQMRVKYQRASITTEWTVGAKANTGDGIIAAEKLGAALDIMEDAWWGPTVPLVGAPWFALSERNSPGSIIVNMAGQRS
jgi:FAD binding domain